jgi:hypothetical protein
LGWGLIIQLVEVLLVTLGNGWVKNHGRLVELTRGQPSKQKYSDADSPEIGWSHDGQISCLWWLAARHGPKKVTQSNIEKHLVNAINGSFAPRLKFVFS